MPNSAQIGLHPGMSPARVVCTRDRTGDEHRAKVLYELAVGIYPDGYVRILWRKPDDTGWLEHPGSGDRNEPFAEWGGSLEEWDPRWRENPTQYRYVFQCPLCGRREELRKASLFDRLQYEAGQGRDDKGRVILDISKLTI